MKLFFIIKPSYHKHKLLVVSTRPKSIAKLENIKSEKAVEGVEAKVILKF